MWDSLLYVLMTDITGTPKSSLNIEAISEIACKEAELYLRHNLVL